MILATVDEITRDAWKSFAETRSTVTARSMIPWGEHCGYCVWPYSLSHCDFHQNSNGGKCGRVNRGVTLIPFPGGVNRYLLKVRFEPWARLWATATIRLLPLAVADAIEKSLFSLSTDRFPSQYRRAAYHRWACSWARWRAGGEPNRPYRANSMLIECYNPSSHRIDVTLTIRSTPQAIPFESRLPMLSGYNRTWIGIEEIGEVIDLTSRLDLALMPAVPEVSSLYFGATDFVYDLAYAPTAGFPAAPR